MLNNVCNIIYLYHMPLFMMISGYVYVIAYFKDGDNPQKKKIYRQVCNICFVYILFSVIFSGIKMFAAAYISKPVHLIDVLLIPVKPIQIFWYLYVLMLLYLLFSIKTLFTFNQRILICVLFCLCCISSCFKIEYFQISKVMYYAFFFYIGILKAQYPEGNAESMVVALSFFFLSIIMCGFFRDSIVYTGERMTNELLPIVKALIALGISLVIWYLFKSVKCLAGNWLLIVLGRYSLEIYLIHNILTTGFKVVLPKLGFTNGYVSLMLNFLLSTSIPVIIALICKKLGIHELVFKPMSFFHVQKRQS